MSIAAPLLCLALVQGGEPGSWRALSLPGLCRAAPRVLSTPRLVQGTHLIVAGPDLDGGEALAPEARIAVPMFAAWLGEEARRQGWSLQVHPTSPPLLVRGPTPSLDGAAGLCAELERASRALEIELACWLVRGPDTSAPGAAAPGSAAAGSTPWARARVLSGEEVLLGERASRSYVHGYSVEVAADSGVAAPMIGRALSGEVVHLRAMRVRGGAAVHVEGLLDLARLASVETFEISATDLGSVEQPRLETLQVAFAGTVENEKSLRIAWKGIAGLGDLAEGSLWIVPRCERDPEGTEAGRWRVLDTALLEAAPWELPLAVPGAQLDASADPGVDEGDWTAFSSAQLVKEAEAQKTSSTRGRPAFVGGRGVVLGPRQDADGWAAILDLVGAFERLRTTGGEITVRQGAAEVRFSAAHGVRWRVLCGQETSAVVDFDVEIAPETWMPGPRVERRIDGFFAQGRLVADGASYSAWSTATTDARVVERDRLPLGRLELSRRTVRQGRGEARAGKTCLAINGPTPLSIDVRIP